MSSTPESASFWTVPEAPDLDLLRASYVDHRYSRHTHDTYAVGVILRGAEGFSYRGARHTAPAGSVVLIDPGEVHTGEAAAVGGWRYRMLYPSVELVRSTAGGGGTPSFRSAVVDDPELARLLVTAHRALEGPDPLARSSLLAGALSALVHRHASARPPARRPTSALDAARPAVRLALELLHADLTASPPLADLAAAAGLSPYHLLRVFRAETGLPPHAYLTQLRVRRARRLLDSGVQPADVALATGFADQSHLTRHFKRIVGVPPGVYARGTAGSTARSKNVQAEGEGAP